MKIFTHTNCHSSQNTLFDYHRDNHFRQPDLLCNSFTSGIWREISFSLWGTRTRKMTRVRMIIAIFSALNIFEIPFECLINIAPWNIGYIPGRAFFGMLVEPLHDITERNVNKDPQFKELAKLRRSNKRNICIILFFLFLCFFFFSVINFWS